MNQIVSEGFHFIFSSIDKRENQLILYVQELFQKNANYLENEHRYEKFTQECIFYRTDSIFFPRIKMKKNDTWDYSANAR